MINTCCFINDAKEESVQTILEMAEYKNSGSCKALIVTGCLAQRYRQEILDEIGEVDAVLGITAQDELIGTIDSVLEGERQLRLQDKDRLIHEKERRIVTTGGH